MYACMYVCMYVCMSMRVCADCVFVLPTGVLAIGGVPIPGEIYAWTVVFILPVNSALNPLLYSFSNISLNVSICIILSVCTIIIIGIGYTVIYFQ